jgi:uncharacterized membrane protein
MIARFANWSVYSWPGRVFLSATPILLSLPGILLTDRYASISRLVYLLGIACASLVVASLIVLNHFDFTPRHYRFSAVFICAIYVFLVLWIVYGIRYLNYATRSGLASEDTAIFEQSFWTTANGQGLLYNTLEGGSHLAIHSSPILIPLALGYSLFPNTIYLFALQTATIGLTALLLFRVGTRFLPSGAALGISLVYLLHPLVLASQFTFHEVFLAPLFFLAAVEFLLAERLPVYILFAAALLTVNERAGLGVLALSLLALLLRRPWYWFGLSVLLGAAGLVGSFAVLSHFRTSDTLPFSFYYFRHLGSTPGAILETVLHQPAQLLLPVANEAQPKALLVYNLLQPFLIVLPFGSLWSLVALPDGVFNFLASGLNDLSWHYAMIMLGLLLGAMMTLRRAGSLPGMNSGKVQTVAATAMVFNTLAMWPLTLNPEALVVNRDQTAVMQRIVSTIPKNASVCADYSLTQYFAARPILYDNQLSSSNQLAACEFVVADRQTGRWIIPAIARLIEREKDEAGWHILIDESDLLLIQRSQ